MARVRLPNTYACVQAGARALGWFSAVMALVTLAYVVSHWPDKGTTVAAGMVGAAMAVVNDSWEAISLFHNGRGRRRPPLLTMLCDLVSLAVCMTGIIMMLFSQMAFEEYPHIVGDPNEELGVFGQIRVMKAGMCILAAVVAWRFVFAFWACWDCSRMYQRTEQRWREEQAEMEDA